MERTKMDTGGEKTIRPNFSALSETRGIFQKKITICRVKLLFI